MVLCNTLIGKTLILFILYHAASIVFCAIRCSNVTRTLSKSYE
jgi:hypothetical protein